MYFISLKTLAANISINTVSAAFSLPVCWGPVPHTPAHSPPCPFILCVLCAWSPGCPSGHSAPSNKWCFVLLRPHLAFLVLSRRQRSKHIFNQGPEPGPARNKANCKAAGTVSPATRSTFPTGAWTHTGQHFLLTWTLSPEPTLPSEQTASRIGTTGPTGGPSGDGGREGPRGERGQGGEGVKGREESVHLAETWQQAGGGGQTQANPQNSGKKPLLPPIFHPYQSNQRPCI